MEVTNRLNRYTKLKGIKLWGWGNAMGSKTPGNALLITFSFTIKTMYELMYNLYS